MKTSHKGMRISESDWQLFLGHVVATLNAFRVPEKEMNEVRTFIERTKSDILDD